MEVRHKNINRIIITIILSAIISCLFNVNSTISFASEQTKSTLGNLYVSEEEYQDKMSNVVTPYLENIIETGYITGEEDLDIYYEKYLVPDSKGSIVISHGFTEYTGRYTELIYYFLQKGYSVFIFDHRGHGNSGSLGTVDETEVNVEDYDYYVSDLKSILDEVVLPSKGENEKLFLYAHSMGGCIGTLFLEEYPEYFDAAILNSPMLEINTGKTPSFIAKAIAWIADFIGFGDSYVFGQGEFSGSDDIEDSGTSSAPRFEYSYNKIMDKDEYAKRGGASFRWLKEGFSATKKAVDKDNAEKVEIPVLLFQAENDSFVKPDGQNKFQENAKNCKLEVVKDAKHEIYREKDDILLDYLNQVFEFYENNL